VIVNQEMVLRLGAVTGVGYAKLILERQRSGDFNVGALRRSTP
jgi:Mn2+/Fe2+ NRAMP family transporter